VVKWHIYFCVLHPSYVPIDDLIGIHGVWAGLGE
jgi:hypothetical protein